MSIAGQVTFGLLSYVPGVYSLLARGTGGTDSARYCYSVWLRHLTLAHEHGLAPTTPASVAELGPGDTLGTGLAALLSGAGSYTALDVVRHARVDTTLKVFDELTDLFRRREPIPTDDEFPRLKPRPASFGFPRGILTEAVLERSLAPVRLEHIRRAIEGIEANAQFGRPVTYCAPWDPGRLSGLPSVRMVLSQAVLEYVDDAGSVFAALNRWLAPGGFMSHQVDLSSHGRSRNWDGHWAYSKPLWRLMRGNRPCFLNRLPCSAYVQLLGNAGFDVVHVVPVRERPSLDRSRLAPPFRGLSSDDLETRAVFLLASKPETPATPEAEEPER